MAIGALVSVEEYLRTSYRPDCDYVDGEVVERNFGERSHGRLQGNIVAWMHGRESRWRMKVVPEVRLRIAAKRFRIPDLMLLSEDAPYEEVVQSPPILCIEILSSCDTPVKMWKRAEDYFPVSVPVCWIIDPFSGKAWAAAADSLTEVSDGVLRAGSIEMPLAEVLE
jgi:Uma2 family endonuclease